MMMLVVLIFLCAPSLAINPPRSWGSNRYPSYAKKQEDSWWPDQRDSANALVDYLKASVISDDEKAFLESKREEAINTPAFRVTAQVVQKLVAIGEEKDKLLNETKARNIELETDCDLKRNSNGQRLDQILEILNERIAPGVDRTVQILDRDPIVEKEFGPRREYEGGDETSIMPERPNDSPSALGPLPGANIFKNYHKISNHDGLKSRVEVRNFDAKEVKIESALHEIETKKSSFGVNLNTAGSRSDAGMPSFPGMPKVPLVGNPDAEIIPKKPERLQNKEKLHFNTPAYIVPVPIVISLPPKHIIITDLYPVTSSRSFILPDVKKQLLGGIADYSTRVNMEDAILIQQNLVCVERGVYVPFNIFVETIVGEHGNCNKENRDKYEQLMKKYTGVEFIKDRCY